MSLPIPSQQRLDPREEAPYLSHEQVIAQLSYENEQLKDEQQQMCSMLLDIAYHIDTPRKQRGEILLFLSLFDYGRAATEKRQRNIEEQGTSQETLTCIAKVRDSAENLAHLPLCFEDALTIRISTIP